MNNNIIRISRLLLSAIFICLCHGSACGKPETAGDSVGIRYEQLGDNAIRVIEGYNDSSHKIKLWIDGKYYNVDANKRIDINKIARNYVRIEWHTKASGPFLWNGGRQAEKKKNTEPEKAEKKQDKATPQPKEQPTTKVGKPVNEVQKAKPAPAAPPVKNDEDIEEPRPADDRAGYRAFEERLERDPFFGEDAVYDYVRQVDSYVNGLSEADDKAQFLTDSNILQFLRESEAELAEKKTGLPTTAIDLIGPVGITDAAYQTKLNKAIKLLNDRLTEREEAYEVLKDAVASVESGSDDASILSGSVINYAIIGVIVLILLIWVIYAIRRKKGKKGEMKSPRARTPVQQPHDYNGDNPDIVVRRRTTSILKKQCIDDVKGNPDYLQINASDFTQDSAVKNIYIKNTCIKEVYDLYAEDLRNSGNPKEDGCMVLGRWVYDENSHTYDVSMEATVFPGDDAVFKEYELNFGGKIKLRVAEKLRKLRRDTNLQYDLVCWIHSHPGLGVFFSNSDVNVQMQLKHAQHPNFLIAFVIDILTSTQETGIFTFRHDGTMNSRGDLTKLYSLEDMYKWTLERERASFSPDNYYNILGKSKMQMPSCRGIELNNSSIIDLSQRVLEPVTGLVGRAVGTSCDVNGSKEYVVSGIARADERPGAGVIGLLLNVAHISLPTIQRLIAGECGNIAFVMVYSSRQNTVTSIPVINGELIMDEHFYGEETIDDLKIWTRRKR